MTMDEEDLTVQNLYKANKMQQKRIKKLEAENRKSRELLQDALPHIECKNNSQSGLITEIGEYLEQANT